MFSEKTAGNVTKRRILVVALREPVAIKSMVF
jgi:hypothetical protein